MMIHRQAICYLIVLTVLSFVIIVTEANKTHTTQFPQTPFNPGETSYFDIMKKSRMKQTNESMKEDMEHLMDYVSKLTEPRTLKEMLGAQMPGGNLMSKVFSNMPPTQCTNDTQRILRHIRQTDFKHFNKDDWAVQMIDSMGKPGPSLTSFRLKWVGNYEQCRVVQVPPDPTEFSKGFNGAYVVSKLIMGNPFNPMAMQAQWGLCLPDTCSAPEIYMLLNTTLAKSNNNITKQVTLLLPDILTDEREYTAATCTILTILCIIVSLMIIGTCYDIIIIQWNKTSTGDVYHSDDNYSQFRNDNPHVYHIGMESSTSRTEPMSPTIEKPGKLVQVLLAFSVYTNASKLLNTTQPPGSLGAIHGIRFLSMSWVILGHVFFFGVQFFVNGLHTMSLTKRWTFDAIDNALVSVDTFFALSGLLTTYLTMKEMKKKSWKINWGLFYFHRFWRLTPPYMLTLLFVLGLQRFFGSGAQWATTQPVDKTFCEKNWWTNMLYVNNLVKKEETCFGHSWYLALDMQYFVISPLMIIPFYFNVYAGVVSCLVFLLANWGLTGYVSVDDGLGVNSITGVEGNIADYVFDYYWAPWCRMGPFVVGVITGYFLAVHKGRIPLNRIVNVVGWALATATGLACVYGIHGDVSGENPSSLEVAAVYNAAARTAWGACVCWVIVSCTSGYGGFVNKILSWSPFVVLGRLTYMAYLIHPSLLYIYYGNMDQLFYVNDFNIIITYLGMLIFANMTAFVLSMAFESPMIGLEKVFIPRRR